MTPPSRLVVVFLEYEAGGAYTIAFSSQDQEEPIPPEVRQDQHRKRRYIDHELLEKVAKVYQAADRAPTKTVAQAFSVSIAQASRYVAAARADGYLAPLQNREG